MRAVTYMTRELRGKEEINLQLLGHRRVALLNNILS